jgi:hypothetical protein
MGQEDDEGNVSSYWMTLQKREDTGSGSTSCTLWRTHFGTRLWTRHKKKLCDDDDIVTPAYRFYAAVWNIHVFLIHCNDYTRTSVTIYPTLFSNAVQLVA